VLYKVECPTPANTSPRLPIVTRCRVYPGEVTRVWVGFPKGCYGLCHLQVWHQGIPAWPWSPADSFHWNNYMFTFADKFPLKAAPFEFVIKTWNYDDFYPHTPVFMVLVEPAKVIKTALTMDQVFAELGTAIGKEF